MYDDILHLKQHMDERMILAEHDEEHDEEHIVVCYMTNAIGNHTRHFIDICVDRELNIRLTLKDNQHSELHEYGIWSKLPELSSFCIQALFNGVACLRLCMGHQVDISSDDEISV